MNPCPDVLTTVNAVDPNSKCDPGGHRTVTGSVTVSPDPTNPMGATIKMDGSVIGSHAAASTPYTIPFSVPLLPGGHTLTVTPSGVGCGAASTAITVPKCPGTEACPVAEIAVEPGACERGKRSAKVTVSVTPGSPTDANLTHGTQSDSKVAQVTPFTLTITDYFTTGGDAVVLNVTKPSGCPPTSLPVMLEPCPPDQGPGPGPGGGQGGDNDDDGGGGGCLIGRVFVALLMASALFMALVGFCIAPAMLVVAAGLAIAAAAAFALWWWLCGTKCSALLLMWQVMMIGGWVCAFLATCCPIALILALALGAASMGLFAGWITSCKPNKCKIFSELLWVYVAAIGTIFAYLTSLAPCGLLVIPAITASIAAGLAIAVAATCPK